MALKDNIKRIRQLKNVKVSQIVANIGGSKESYYAYERGEYSPSEEYLNKLAGLFGCSVKDFFDDGAEGENEKETGLEEINLLIKNLDRMGNFNEHLLKRVQELEKQLDQCLNK